MRDVFGHMRGDRYGGKFVKNMGRIKRRSVGNEK